MNHTPRKLLPLLCSLLALGFVSCGHAPKTSALALTFEEEFLGNALDAEKWISQNGASGHILSSRWAENNIVSNGMLYQIIRKEKRGGKDWTAASIWTKFSQRYGRFECRYRYGGGSGLNNAFWVTVKDPTQSNAFNQVLDINKGRYSNQVYIHLHRKPVPGKPAPKDVEKIFTVDGADFSKNFAVFSMDWTALGLRFTIDGKEVGRISNEEGASELTGPAVVHVSTAVMPEAGPITDDLSGRAMVVDWVRVYQYK